MRYVVLIFGKMKRFKKARNILYGVGENFLDTISCI